MEQIRAYGYFDRSFGVELAIFLFFSPTLVTLWTITAYYYYFTGILSLPLIKSAAYFTTFLIFSLVFYKNARFNSKFKAVIIEKEKIVKKGVKGITDTLPFAEITGVRLYKIPLIRRWIILKSSNNTLSVPLHVRGACGMVENIFKNMEKNNNFTVNESDKQLLLNAARRSNTLQKVRIKNLPVVLRVTAATALFNAATALIFWESTLLITLIWGFCSMFFALTAYFITEIFHLKSLLEAPAGKQKNTFFENYLLAGLCAALACMTTAFFIISYYP
jgi:hypothetical protein